MGNIIKIYWFRTNNWRRYKWRKSKSFINYLKKQEKNNNSNDNIENNNIYSNILLQKRNIVKIII